MSNLKRDTLKNKIAEIILFDFYGRVQKYPRGKTISADPEVDQIINLIESVIPEEKDAKFEASLKVIGYSEQYVKGYNQAIKDIKSKLIGEE